MAKKAAGFGLVILIAAGFAIVYTGWRMETTSKVPVCAVCGRPIHAGTRTVALIAGKKEVFCCPMCAITAARQTGREVKIIELTDGETNRPLAPANAVLVVGSEVNLCSRRPVLRERDKQTAPLAFDRCSPSVLAFSNRVAAETFQRRHGGKLMRVNELEAIRQSETSSQ